MLPCTNEDTIYLLTSVSIFFLSLLFSLLFVEEEGHTLNGALVCGRKSDFVV